MSDICVCVTVKMNELGSTHLTFSKNYSSATSGAVPAPAFVSIRGGGMTRPKREGNISVNSAEKDSTPGIT